MKKAKQYAIRTFMFIMLFFFSIIYSFSQSTKKELRTEDDGFKWYIVKSYQGIQGALNKNGQVLIPLSRGYNNICYISQKEQPEGYFNIQKAGKEGACDINGKEIVPPIYYLVVRHGGKSEPYYYGVANELWEHGVCDKNGKEIISPHYDFPCILQGGNNGNPYWYSIEKDGKQGACNIMGKVVIQPRYEDVIYHNNNFEVKKNGNFSSTGIVLNSNAGKLSTTNSNGNGFLMQSFGKFAAGLKERARKTNDRTSPTVKKAYYDCKVFSPFENVKQVEVTKEYHTNDVRVSNFLLFLSENHQYKFNSNGKLINAKELKISNMQYNEIGYLVSYICDGIKYILIYDFFELQSGEIKGRLKKKCLVTSSNSREEYVYEYYNKNKFDLYG